MPYGQAKTALTVGWPASPPVRNRSATSVTAKKEDTGLDAESHAENAGLNAENADNAGLNAESHAENAGMNAESHAENAGLNAENAGLNAESHAENAGLNAENAENNASYVIPCLDAAHIRTRPPG
eukprot:gene15168-21240_t